MKGLVIERARPSNTIDVYPLIKEAAKEGIFYGPAPTEKSIKEYYYKLLTQELPLETHFFYLARRSKGFLGLLHAVIVPSRWDWTINTMFVDFVFVREHRRKYGIGKDLINRMMKDAAEIGIKNFEFLSPESQVEFWEKEHGAKKTSVLMRVVAE